MREKLGSNLKDYLNAQETNEFFWLLITSAQMGDYRENFSKYGTITQDEHRSLKMSETYLKKFAQSVVERMSQKTVQKLNDRLSKYEIKIIDYHTKRRLYGDWEKEFGTVKMEREKYFNWCSEIMNAKCRGCTKKHDECELYDIFDDTLIPGSDWDLPNCNYAYDVKGDIANE